MKLLKAVCCSLVLAMSSASSAVLAQDNYPSKPIRFVVGFPPGGGVDIVARVVSEQLAKALGQPVVVENKPGANAIIAAEHVAKSPADGYTFLVTPTSTLKIDQLMRPVRHYNPETDLIPVSGLAVTPFVLAVNPAVPARSVKELISLAKQKPDALNYGSPNLGMKLASGMFLNMADVKMYEVAYKGSSQGLMALLSNEIQVLILDSAPIAPHVKSGKLRALAVTTPTRAGAFPELPTMKEAGLPDYDWTPFMALFAPTGVPPAIINKVQAEIAKAFTRPEVKEKMVALTLDPNPMTAAELGEFVRRESARITAVVKSGAVKLEQ
jgi:tripartite-type tricarboxylate transporter receptor subunit TctC